MASRIDNTATPVEQQQEHSSGKTQSITSIEQQQQQQRSPEKTHSITSVEQQQQQQQQRSPEKVQSMAERFEEWMVKFERVYKDAEEKERRFRIFADLVEYIDALNASGKNSHTAGLNQFSDLTSDEFYQLYCFDVMAMEAEEEAVEKKK